MPYNKGCLSIETALVVWVYLLNLALRVLPLTCHETR